MRVAILQSNYIPWKGYFHLIQDVDIFCFYDDVKYTKNDWRNRNQILLNGQPSWLTIPVDKNSVKQTINSVKITDSRWQKKHYKSIVQGYSKCTNFKQLHELIKDFLQDQQWEFLSELNQYVIRKISSLLKIDTQIERSSDYHLESGRIDRLLGLLHQLGATTYVSGPSAREYLELEAEKFNESNINIEYFKYPDYPQYDEIYENHISILDLIAKKPYREIPDYIWN